MLAKTLVANDIEKIKEMQKESDEYKTFRLNFNFLVDQKT